MRSILLLILFLIIAIPDQGLTAAPRVLFDQSHGQAFTIEKEGELQLSRLAEQFRSQGWQVSSTTNPLTRQTLADVDALIISGAFKPLSEAELNAVGRFLLNGGRMAVMLHIAPPLVPLLGKLGVASANGVVREGETTLILDGEALNFRVNKLEKHPLTSGLTEFSLYGGWPLLPTAEHARTIARTSPTAWVDLNKDRILSPRDAVREFGVVIAGTVGKGEFAVFADDAIFQNRFLQGENKRLADNLGRWLQGGSTLSI
ncbi:MAG TPA: DUF4350 domain-containing protein [Geopsychrobacteraceae bacterium]|nr:DUF4350 domain-containing protein [Geopsychrobacteraceae bacterium]